MKRLVTRHNNFIYLFTALVALLFLTSWNQELPSDGSKVLFRTVTVAMLLLGVLSLRTRHSWVWTVLALAAANLLLFMFDSRIDNVVADISQLLIWCVFFAGSFWLSFRQIVESRVIDTNMMIGSVVLYLLLGLTWTTLYMIVLLFFPDAFNGIAADSDLHAHFPQLAYYSFITLTTLGYGDISPRNGLAQFLAYAEAVTGVFYVAVIVSTLVSARLTMHREDTAKAERK